MNTKLMEKLVPQADRAFENVYRELLASFNMKELGDGVRAYIRLHKRSEILAQENPTFDFYLGLLETSFITLYDREAINPAAPITSLGEKALTQMRTKTGIGVENLPAPAAPVLSPEEQLANEVKNDWKTLPSDKIKAKMNANKAYKAMFQKLSETDEINSQCALHSVISGVGA
jgi:hypothetical protein